MCAGGEIESAFESAQIKECLLSHLNLNYDGPHSIADLHEKGQIMNTGRPALAVFLIALATTLTLQGQAAPPEGPAIRDGHVEFPADYREWVFLSSGLGMTYGPNATPPGQPQNFSNVYVNPASYRTFMRTGHWPDRTMFVLEIRGSVSEGSINRAGHFQTGILAIEASAKDARLPGGWGFFNFGTKQAPVAPLPASDDCYTCHRTHAAVEHTFVQFYPSLMDVARRLGTLNPGYRDAAR